MNLLEEIQKLTLLGACTHNPKFTIYTTDAKTSPAIIMAIGLERKQSFGKVGVVVDSAVDLDDYDVTTDYQQAQMFIWDTEKQRIVGGYRYSYNTDVPPEHSPMGKYFTFTDQFKEENWIHLGRSFLSVDYQNSRYGILALMDGLGCLFAKAKAPMGFFGKITIPNTYGEATDFLVAFCKRFWIDGTPLGSVKKDHEKNVSDVADFIMEHFRGDYKEVTNFLKEKYERPGLPILRMYDSLAQSFASIHFLGAFVHQDFGGATEVGMAIAKENLSAQALETYIQPYMESFK